MAQAREVNEAADQLPIAERYALVVGHNQPGPGQSALRYAEQDAEAFADVLTTLGGFPEDRVMLLRQPTAAKVRAALSHLEAEVGAQHDRGARTLVTFYYSGHARRDRLDLGADPLPLEELRASLEGLEATVTLVVLDACRSGSFSRAKGATAVADFGFDRARQLDTRGLAVMASSAAEELSQESERLQGSFFTHHLLAALRGAGDTDTDGRVSLREAYTYAYNQTLVSTAQTAIGQQHVSFETGLEGRGALWLTAPGENGSQLVLPSDLAGEALVTHQGPSGTTVIAELHRPQNGAVSLAVSPGRYQTLLRQGDQIGTCVTTVAPGARQSVSPAQCAFGPVTATVDKGALGAEGTDTPSRRWSVEVALGLADTQDSPYTDRLRDFDYHRQDALFDLVPRYVVGAGYQLDDVWSVHLTGRNLGQARWRIHADGADDVDTNGDTDFTFNTLALTVHLRRQVNLFDGRLVPYVQAGAGPALAWSRLENSPIEYHGGFALMGGAGVQLMPWDVLGGFVEFSWSYAPVMENLIGDTHDHGGRAFIFGLRGAL